MLLITDKLLVPSALLMQFLTRIYPETPHVNLNVSMAAEVTGNSRGNAVGGLTAMQNWWRYQVTAIAEASSNMGSGRKAVFEQHSLT